MTKKNQNEKKQNETKTKLYIIRGNLDEQIMRRMVSLYTLAFPSNL